MRLSTRNSCRSHTGASSVLHLVALRKPPTACFMRGFAKRICNVIATICLFHETRTPISVAHTHTPRYGIHSSTISTRRRSISATSPCLVGRQSGSMCDIQHVKTLKTLYTTRKIVPKRLLSSSYDYSRPWRIGTYQPFPRAGSPCPLKR